MVEFRADGSIVFDSSIRVLWVEDSDCPTDTDAPTPLAHISIAPHYPYAHCLELYGVLPA